MTTEDPKTESGLAPNIASFLCYACFFMTSIVFLVVEKDNKMVRFHAWQSLFFSIFAFVVISVLSIIGAVLGFISSLLSALFGTLLSPVFGLVCFVLWVVCMVKAYNGEMYKLPIVGDLAEKQANR